MRILTTSVLIICCPAAWSVAQNQPQVDQAEVLRLGNVVQAVGDDGRAAVVDDYVAALAPPTSDADKWFISIVTTKGCAACEQLKREWSKDPWLLALAIPTDPANSWAHYNVYPREDTSQAFRFQGISITAYPTVLVQPPRNGKFGDPKAVVFQGVHGGDPRKLAEAITQAIGQYVSRLRPAASSPGAAKAGDYDPPWQPSTDESASPFPDNDKAGPLDRLRQVIPPPQPAFPWSLVIASLSAGFSIPTAAALLLWAISFIRARRQAAGKPPLIDPDQLERLMVLLEQVAGSNRPPRSGA